MHMVLTQYNIMVLILRMSSLYTEVRSQMPEVRCQKSDVRFFCFLLVVLKTLHPIQPDRNLVSRFWILDSRFYEYLSYCYKVFRQSFLLSFPPRIVVRGELQRESRNKTV